MMFILVAAASLIGVAAWLFFRSSGKAPLSAPTHDDVKVRRESAAPAANAADDALRQANALASEKLWRLAFGAPSTPHNSLPDTNRAHQRVRANVVAILQVDDLQANYLPRRPALLPQLLQAVNDPGAESERLARIVAHDPVLTADILRLANSSLYRTSSVPIETIQRAIVVCGVEALRSMAAAAMLGPVFRATRRNFPRFPRMLWERTERAARAAELYAMEVYPKDRLEAQLVVLLASLGPLAVYGATLDIYSRNPHFTPSGDLCAELVSALAPSMSVRIARDWQASERLVAALDNSPAEPLTAARNVGELLGTLSFLESQTVISREESLDHVKTAAVSAKFAQAVWARWTANA